MLHLGFVQLSESKQTATLNLSILAVHKKGQINICPYHTSILNIRVLVYQHAFFCPFYGTTAEH